MIRKGFDVKVEKKKDGIFIDIEEKVGYPDGYTICIKPDEDTHTWCTPSLTRDELKEVVKKILEVL
jgi:hypothetical protein